VRRGIMFWGVLLALLGAGIIFGAPAHAANDYPYPTKPCVHAPYTVTGSGPNWCPNYDWGDRPNDTTAANVISPYGYYYRNCTDYAAWRVSTHGVQPAQYKGLGNAKDWASRAPSKGVPVNGAPAVGSVGVRISGKFGHTAFVEEVRPDGTIRVSQYNNGADGNYSESVGTPAAFGFSAFVHFEVFFPPQPPPPAPPPVPEPAPIEEPAPEPVASVVEEPTAEPADVQAEAVEESAAEAEVLSAETPQPVPEPSPAQTKPQPVATPPSQLVPKKPAAQPEGRGSTEPKPQPKGLPLPLTTLAASPATEPHIEEIPRSNMIAALLNGLQLWSVVGLASCVILRKGLI